MRGRWKRAPARMGVRSAPAAASDQTNGARIPARRAYAPDRKRAQRRGVDRIFLLRCPCRSAMKPAPRFFARASHRPGNVVLVRVPALPPKRAGPSGLTFYTLDVVLGHGSAVLHWHGLRRFPLRRSRETQTTRKPWSTGRTETHSTGQRVLGNLYSPEVRRSRPWRATLLLKAYDVRGGADRHRRRQVRT